MKGGSQKPDGIPALNQLGSEFVRVGREQQQSTSRRVGRRYSTVAVAALLLVFVVAAAATFLGVRSSEDDATTQAEQAQQGTGFAASGPRYETLRELVRVSDLIIVGTVREVLPAQPEGEPPEEIYHVNTVVAVDEVLKGSTGEEAVTVKTLEEAYAGPNGEEWRQQSERVVLFLSPSRETPGLYIPANVDYYQTAYVIVGEDLIATLSDDELARQIAGLSLPELRERVRQGP